MSNNFKIFTDKKLYTIKEIADKTGSHKLTVYTLLKKMHLVYAIRRNISENSKFSYFWKKFLIFLKISLILQINKCVFYYDI